jgi:lytic murein transglycosylase
MRFPRLRAIAVASLLTGAFLAGPALAASSSCQSAPFNAWLDGVRKEASAAGISQRAISVSLDGVAFDQSIISHDRGQGVFHQSFEEFSGRMIPPRMKRAAALLHQYAPIFDKVEAQYGVPGPVIVAIWGLETDFGAVTGNFPTIRALATLAYDCRRADYFHGQLLDALRLVDRGYFSPQQMHGAWAGELGQTQFMPDAYIKFAVDFDGRGRPDLIHDVPDVLASTANFLHSYGWQRGQGWEPGQPNFAIIQAWNKSDVYSRTIAAFATRLAAGGK